MEAETEALRRAAPSWSLAGDKRLLDTLQKVHETLLTKCNDTSSQLDAVCTALTDAALALDNVNNRFMSLSNSQFVERRVYDDDADVAAPAGDLTSQKTHEQPLTTSEPTTEKMKRALKVLESTHETVVIMADSDSDSGSEEDGDIDRVVLRPRDLYRERPLPYIIGSKAWKGKWHAGILPDASESDSDQTNASDREFEEYSDNDRYSASEGEERPVIMPAVTEQISSSSSEVVSERDLPNAPVNAQPLSPAAIAAELARRLQGHQPPTMPPQPVTEECQPQEAPRKLYKPEKPAPGTIFPDEPPPLDSSDHDDDIFAELRKSKPFVPSNNVQNSIAKDLFGVKGTDDLDDGSEEDDDIFNDFPPKAKNTPTSAPVVKQSAPVNEPETKHREPAPSATKPTEDDEPASTNKKPVGGISIFHGSQNTAIGAAILKRQRQAASGDDTDGSEVINAPKQTTHKPESKEKASTEKEKTHRDIFDDLFAKSEKVIAKRKIVNDVVKESAVKTEEKVSLFRDDIFDDIDDIFTNDFIPQVPIKEAVTRDKRSLPFDDDDDLFKDIIAVTNTSAPKDNVSTDNVTDNVINETVSSKKTSIFDSDDEFFNDKYPAPKRNPIANKQSTESKNATDTESVSEATHSVNNTSGIANTISDTDELFAKTKSTDFPNVAKSSPLKNDNAIQKIISDASMRGIGIFDSDEELFAENDPEPNIVNVAKEATTSAYVKNVLASKESISTTDKRTDTIRVTDDELFSESISYVEPMDFTKKATSSHGKSEIASKENIISAIQSAKRISEENNDEKILSENKPDPVKGASSQVKYHQTIKKFNDTEPEDDIFVNTKQETWNEIITKTDAIKPNTDTEAKSKTTLPEKINIFKDEASFNFDNKYAGIKTEQIKRGTYESDEDLYKKYSNKETKVTSTANLDEQQVRKIMEERTIEDKAQFVDNIMKPDGDVGQKFAVPKTLSPDNIAIFNDEASFIKDDKTEQRKRGTEDLNKNYANKNTKESPPNVDEKRVLKKMEENTIVDRAEFLDNIMKPVDDVIQELDPNTNNDFIESVLHSSDNKNVNDEEFLPYAPEGSSHKVRKIENILSETELKIKTGEYMKFHDILQDHKDVPKTNVSTLAKPELLRKPRAHKDLDVTPNYNSKDTKSVDEKINSTKVNDDNVDNMNVLDSNKNVTLNKTGSTTTNKPITTPTDIKPSTPDIFSEILNDVPPIFEKPKERKRSQNVNALFDDDSDDEALFYRKSDATFEDVPKIKKRESPFDDNERFKLFMNEPPAIDDFEYNAHNTKSVVGPHKCLIRHNEMASDEPDNFDNLSYEKRNKVDRIFTKRDVTSTANTSHDSDDELFTSKSENLKSEPTKTETKNIPDNNEQKTRTLNKVDVTSTVNKFDGSDDDELLTSKSESAKAESYKVDIKDTSDSKQQTPTKKIGKLKPTNLNINVNTLLPGALPKKSVKNVEQTDGQTVASHSTEELPTTHKTTTDDEVSEPSLVKSVSFDEDPESTLLDNKLSKERARITVKRRPSSRKARREASRKSGIDFGEDLTDNSNSIDDISKSEDVSGDYSQTVENKDDILDSLLYDSLAEDSNSKSNIKEAHVNIINKNSTVEKADDNLYVAPAVEKANDVKKETKKCGHVMKECKCSMKTEHTNQVSTSTDVNRHQETSGTSKDVKSHQDIDTSTNVLHQEVSEKSKDVKKHPDPATLRDVKSKVVYILHDEDIFNDTKPQKSTDVLSKPKILNIVEDDDDDIFKSITPAGNNAEAKSNDQVIKKSNDQVVKKSNDQVVKKSNDQVIKTLGNVYKTPAKNDDSDDDIFKDKQIIKSVSKPREKPSQTIEKYEVSNDEVRIKRETDTIVKAKNSIFDDLSDEENALFNSKQKTIPQKKHNKTTLFDSDSDSELFSGKSKKGREDTSTVIKKEIKRVEVKGSLFGDDDDDDIFGAKPKKTASSLTPSSSSRHESEVKPQTSSSDPLSALLGE